MECHLILIFFFFNKKTKETARPIQSIWVLLRETCDAYCLQSEPNFNSIQNDNPKLQNEKCRTLNQFFFLFFFLNEQKKIENPLLKSKLKIKTTSTF